jgi:hypothetical protein
MDETFAFSLAQIHLQSDEAHVNWTAFLERNCTLCTKSTESCDFFHPTKKNITVNGTSPEALRSAQVGMVETGRYTRCPSLTEQDSPA